jgi:hypothetical protein
MFSRSIVTNITSALGTLHCRKTRIPCGDQLMIYGQYLSIRIVVQPSCHYNRSYEFGLAGEYKDRFTLDVSEIGMFRDKQEILP